MDKHPRHKAGYSLVELLVTIVIAGIAFAAMVPLFVQAQQTGPKDKYRTTAVNLAQDRLERVRQLPFSAVTTEALLDPTAELGAGTGLDAQLQWGSRQVDGKYYTITPSVVDVNTTTRRVTVTVSWREAPNNTHRQISLQTDIFRQLPGPQILSLKTDPAQVPSADPNKYYINSVPADGITITALIQPAQALEVGRVRFTIVDMSGATSPVIQFVSTPDSGTKNSFSYSWAAGTPLHDGLYRISAVAYSKATNVFPAEQGNTRDNDVWIEQTIPPAVTGVVAYSGKVSPAVVNLLWPAYTAAADLHHFEVWRQDVATGGWTQVGADVRTFGFKDASVVAGSSYAYVVRAVDTFGNALDYSTMASVAAAPLPSGAASAPAAPRDLRLSFAGGTMTVQWSAPASSADVVGYHVYRATAIDHGDARIVASIGAGSATYAARDDLEWGSTYFYTVKSFNADGAESPVAAVVTGGDKDGAGWAQYVTPIAPEYQLYVQLRNIPSKKSVTVRIMNTDTGEIVEGSPFTFTTTSNTRTLDLPFGVYTVTMQYGSDVRSTSASLTGDPTKIVYITFII